MHHFLYDPETRLTIREDAQAASFPFPGVFLWENFISEEEEEKLISTMDQDVWNESQSGRRKQVMWNTCCFMNVISTHTQHDCDQIMSICVSLTFVSRIWLPNYREQGRFTSSLFIRHSVTQSSLQHLWNLFCIQLTYHQLGVKQIGFQCNLLSKIVCTSFW